MSLKKVYNKANKSYLYGTSAAGRYHAALGQPLYLEKADGPYLYDLEDNEYIDFNSSAGAAFFGYNHPRIRKDNKKSI
jgi:glutamate-1-semialdehyde 2,1-aminomutase